MSDELIQSAKPMILKYAKLYAPYTYMLTFDDLISYGYLGACKLLKRFDPSRGTPFFVYVEANIKNEMLIALRRDWNKGVNEPSIWGKKQHKRPIVKHVGYPDLNRDVDDEDFAMFPKSYINEYVFEDIYEEAQNLASRERDIFLSHYLEGVTLTKLAKRYKISIERVRQLAVRAKKQVLENVGRVYEI